MLLTLNSCGYYVYPPKVKVRYAYDYTYKSKLFKDWQTSKWRKFKTKTEYVKYDRNGNEIEIGEYGERWCKVISQHLPDSSVQITSYSGTFPKKLNTVTYKAYNDSNQVVTEEVWRFKDNKKDYLVYKTIFSYTDTQLTKETEFDADGKIISEKDYDLLSNVQNENRNKTIYEPFARVDGNRIDTVRYDTSGQVIEKIHYYNGKFLYRQEFLYSDFGTIKTELRYDDKPDSLWSITEWRYDIITKQLTRKYWNVINSTTERREEFIYDRKKLLRRIERYNAEEKTGYTKYKYKLY
tara:strand:+ start:968 stop:1852 length:885 start_codon:yes stop_codon:yes gene_type:complete